MSALAIDQQDHAESTRIFPRSAPGPDADMDRRGFLHCGYDRFGRVRRPVHPRARAVLAVAPATWPGRVILIDLSSEEDHPLVELLPPR